MYELPSDVPLISTCVAFPLTPDTEDIEALVSQTVDTDDEAGTVRLALCSNVVVLCLIEDVRGADAVLAALQVSRNESGGPSHLLVLSTTMTWAKTKHASAVATVSGNVPSSRSLMRPASMMAIDKRSSPSMAALSRAASAIGSGMPLSRDNSRSPGTKGSKNSGRGTARGTGPRRRQQGGALAPAMTEGDYLLRQPPTGYLEHKRLEVAALSLQSTALSVCVVGAGVPYGLGEGPLFRVFREAWRAGDEPVLLPTCTSGDNRLALIHVVDLSVAVGRLLCPVQENNDAPPPPFPKPYILAVDGDRAQCTAKELTAAIGRGFGGRGETRPMEGAELEEVLVEEPSALSLLFDVRFSNNGGVLAGMMADGKRSTRKLFMRAPVITIGCFGVPTLRTRLIRSVSQALLVLLIATDSRWTLRLRQTEPDTVKQGWRQGCIAFLSAPPSVTFCNDHYSVSINCTVPQES